MNNNDNSLSISEKVDVQYYPRNARAPYLFDTYDLGIGRIGLAGEGSGGLDSGIEDGTTIGMLLGGDHDSGSTSAAITGSPAGRIGRGSGGGGFGKSGSLFNLTTSTGGTSSSASQQSSNNVRRRSSFARVLSTLGISPMAIAEEEGGEVGGENSATMITGGGGPDDSGGGMMLHYFQDSETNPNSLMPPKFRRGVSSESSVATLSSFRDRSGSNAGVGAGGSRIPRWALHDLSSIVMKDGMPISLGALVQYNHRTLLLHRSQNTSIPTSMMTPPQYMVTPSWRLKERMKTVGVCLVLALNIGTDPPDLNKPTPCAKLQCWLDPTSVSRAKAKERIGERLEQQYAKWQQRSKLKYRRALDPTVEVVKDLCLRMRESARTERVLFHYNGQGVPRPTANGEIWLFDKHHTNYIPLSVTDLRRWIGRPSIVVLDCSGAGVLMPFFTSALESSGITTALDPMMSSNSIPPGGGGGSSSSRNGEESYLKAIRDTIVLCPTSQGEWLPLNPVFPADLFTSCLTTPIAVALRWFIRQTPLSTQGLDLETIADAIPGKLTDRKTPLGELNWIFTAITDTIAWNVLPSPLFQRLFRQDLLVASLFRNYLLADRILRSLNCTPTSHPELPSTCHHPLWQAWDLAVETCLTKLLDSGCLKRGGSIGSMGDVAVSSSSAAEGGEGEDVTNTAQPQSSESHTRQMSSSSSGGDRVDVDKSVHLDVNAPFFAEQLTAFELWLEWASAKSRNKLVIRCPPSAVGGTPLPFLQGREDAELASHELDPPQELPIVLQVLLSPAHRVRTLVLLRRLFELGPSAVNLALSVGIFPYVLKLLQSPIDEYKHVLIGIWARILKFDTSCQEDLVKDRALPHFIRHLSWGYPSPQSNSPTPTPTISLEDASEQRTMAAFILAIICSGYPLGQSEAINEKLHITCCTLLQSLESTDERERVEADTNLTPHFRMWLIICLGNLAKDNPTAQLELYKSGLHLRLLSRLDDDSPDVRMAVCYALGYFIGTAPERPAPSEAYPPLLSTFQQFQQPSQSLAPTFEQGSVPRTLPVSIVGTPTVPLNTIPQPLAISSTSLTPTFNPSATQGHIRPQLVPSLSGLSGQAHGGISLSQAQQPMMLGNILSATVPSARVSPQLESKSVYDDNQRMDFDLSVAIKLAEATKDASPQVRFEAVLAVNRCIAKYIEAFVSIAGNKMFSQLQGRSILGGTVPSIVFPEGLGHDVQKTVTDIWASINRSDPFPSVRELLNSIMGSVNKRAMLEKTRLSQQRANRTSRRSSLGNDYGNDVLPPLLAGANPPFSSSLDPGLKHSSSAGTSTFTIGTPPSVLVPDSVSPRKGLNQSFEAMVHEDYFCPESKFFLWKKVAFGEAADNSPLDPLSADGAMNRYRKTRNNLVREKSQLLKETFAVLAERPRIYQSPYAYDESDAAAGIEKDAELKKEALQLEQMSLLQNTGERSTSFLRFHPFEPALVVCGSSDNVSVWNAESSERMISFSNGNPKNSRITSALWINEESTSLLLTGTNGGTVRIYDGLFETNDEISREKPSLISSFVAAPDIVSDKRYSSGLVLQFQQCTGRLVAGGNTKVIRCWDLSTEKCYNSFDSKSEASLTALTNAWCYEHNGGYAGIGPDVIVAGYGNGSLRVFDIRSNTGEPVHIMNEGRPSLRGRMYLKLDEHTNWIVDVSFTTYGGRHEIVSGCVAGAFKFWDLRYSSSIRTIDHKMQMTALAAHPHIPMLATGSPAQFIKIMSHDGMTQQVIRYHEKISGQRLGPVSSLSFHPHMPYLAAGFADEIVSVYAPKRTIPL